jgi:hypothetical protein
MRAHFGLPSVASDEPDADKWRKRSITVKFEMPYYTVSGIQASGERDVDTVTERRNCLLFLPLTLLVLQMFSECR